MIATAMSSVLSGVVVVVLLGGVLSLAEWIDPADRRGPRRLRGTRVDAAWFLVHLSYAPLTAIGVMAAVAALAHHGLAHGLVARSPAATQLRGRGRSRRPRRVLAAPGDARGSRVVAAACRSSRRDPSALVVGVPLPPARRHAREHRSPLGRRRMRFRGGRGRGLRGDRVRRHVVGARRRVGPRPRARPIRRDAGVPSDPPRSRGPARTSRSCFRSGTASSEALPIGWNRARSISGAARGRSAMTRRWRRN